MEMSLNSDQAKALSYFFFDIAKGIALWVLGSSIVISELAIIFRLANIIGGLAAAYFCVKLGLKFLEE